MSFEYIQYVCIYRYVTSEPHLCIVVVCVTMCVCGKNANILTFDVMIRLRISFETVQLVKYEKLAHLDRIRKYNHTNK